MKILRKEEIIEMVSGCDADREHSFVAELIKMIKSSDCLKEAKFEELVLVAENNLLNLFNRHRLGTNNKSLVVKADSHEAITLVRSQNIIEKHGIKTSMWGSIGSRKANKDKNICVYICVFQATEDTYPSLSEMKKERTRDIKG